MKRILGLVVLLLLVFGLAGAASITVVQPSGLEPWYQGSPYVITWTKDGAMPAQVRITLRNANTLAEVKLIADPAPNTGSYPWTVPADVPAGSYKVRVKVKDAAVSDDSVAFTIAVQGPPPPASIVVDKPAGGDKWSKPGPHNITWTKNGTMPNSVKISLMDKNSAAVVREIADNWPNSQTYSWTIPNDLPFGDYRVRVLVKTTAIKDDSETFSVVAKVVPGATAPVKQKAAVPMETVPVVAYDEYVIKPTYQNWGNPIPHSTSGIQPPQSAFVGYSVGYPPNTPMLAYAHVGYDYHSFEWEGGGTGWLAVCFRSKVYFFIDSYQARVGKLLSAKMRVKQVNVQRLNCDFTSCGTGYFILTALWTDFWNPPITTAGIEGSNGLLFGSTDYTIDITNIVRSWLNGSPMNYGLLLKSQEVTWGQQPKICGSAFDVTLTLRFKKD